MEFVKRNVWWIAAAAVLLAIGYFAFGSKAKASDVPRPPERGEQIVTAPYDWSGFVAGAHAGYAWSETSGNLAIGPGFSYGGGGTGYGGGGSGMGGGFGGSGALGGAFGGTGAGLSMFGF